ncbi:protein arginine N-methyltransferase 5-like [Xenia sp. Carnegie-2017]|uniref:protein arginine N-methyltransferase 5-like n=1 Tax=Xenia sp. Carnegie-2017 TaxID=2897299 RepID=UPI001F04DD8E|nr:protein arginine N-methyltransferase 5-like [Xenia sp. Carnegie-2017]
MKTTSSFTHMFVAFKMAADTPHISCGRDFFSVPDLSQALNSSASDKFHFICLPIAHPRFKREFIKPVCLRSRPFTRSDLLLPSQDWNTLVVGKVSPWINTDSNNDVERKNSEQALLQEIAYAVHLGLPAILVNLTKQPCTNLAAIINGICFDSHVQQFWIRVPMKSPANEIDRSLFEDGKISKKSEEDSDTWEWWNSFRTLCHNTRKVGLALEISNELPTEKEIKRWLGEPIRTLIIPTRIFLTNKKGYPVLSRSHQQFIRHLFKFNVQFVISGSNKMRNKGMITYYQYLDHLYLTRPPLDCYSQFSKGYEDYLQCPLQPLMDNLESQTYEVFEKDPVKYNQYQEAIRQALIDRVSDKSIESAVTVVMVVGAGRGPLVRASFAASKACGHAIKVYAIEKNPNAVVTLLTLKQEEWGDNVIVVSSDMREWNAPEKADILVSELLGSFGDNELSPECLDGAQRFLKDDGISIPESYTSYLAPLSSAKLHYEVSQCREPNKGPQAPFETPYVVRLCNVDIVAEPKACFHFSHPNKDVPIDNSRAATIDYQMQNSCLIHGFAGFFRTVLYKDLFLSIVPEDHSEGMFSWFPIFFPVQHPIYLPENSFLRVHCWRKVSRTKIWYEWCISKPHTIPIHNPCGRSTFIGL